MQGTRSLLSQAWTQLPIKRSCGLHFSRESRPHFHSLRLGRRQLSLWHLRLSRKARIRMRIQLSSPAYILTMLAAPKYRAQPLRTGLRFLRTASTFLPCLRLVRVRTRFLNRSRDLSRMLTLSRRGRNHSLAYKVEPRHPADGFACLAGHRDPRQTQPAQRTVFRPGDRGATARSKRASG